MASMQGYIDFLASCGHQGKLHIPTGSQMKEIRGKAAKYIFEQKQKALDVPKDARFDGSIVDVADIAEDSSY